MVITSFLKWFNFFIFLILNIIAIFICSAIPEDVFTTISAGGSIILISDPLVFFSILIFTLSLQVVYFYYRLSKLVRSEDMFKIFPGDEENKPISTARVPMDVIVGMIDEIGKKLEVSLRAAYVSRQTIPNLISFDFIPFPRKSSVMVLNESAMEISSKQELRCLIAHEIAHIKNHDSTIRILQGISRPFLAFAYIYPLFLVVRELARFTLFGINPGGD